MNRLMQRLTFFGCIHGVMALAACGGSSSGGGGGGATTGAMTGGPGGTGGMGNGGADGMGGAASSSDAASSSQASSSQSASSSSGASSSAVSSGSGGDDCLQNCPPGAECMVCDGVCTDVRFDAKNCGACGNDCQGGACQFTCAPVTLATLGDTPTYLAVDATNVYISSNDGNGTGTISVVPKTGGTVTTFASTYHNTIGELLLDTSYLYYQGPTAVYARPLDDSGQSTLFQSLTTEFAAGNGDLDWVNIFGDPIATTRPALGASTVTAQTARSGGVTVDATNIYWFEGGFPQYVYKAALAGGAKVQIGYSNATITGIAVDANNVYWSTYGSGSVATATLDGGTPRVLATSNATHIKVLADAAGVYMVDDGQIAKLDPGGGAPKVLLTGNFFPQAAVMDATTIYWANGPTGNPGSRTVMRFPR